MRRVGIAGLLLRRGWRVPVLLVLALGVLLLQAAAAGAVAGTAPPAVRATPRANTQMIVSGWRPGQGVTGFIATTSAYNPVAEAYPAYATAPEGFVAKDEGFAGLIQGRPVAPTNAPELNVYCIDINTSTSVGYGYVLGTWEASGVPNVGFVARILDEYFPHTDEPATFPGGAPMSPDERAATVQAAIWAFTDRYVLSTDDPLHAAVAAIVNRVRSLPEVPTPAPPLVLTITPPGDHERLRKGQNHRTVRDPHHPPGRQHHRDRHRREDVAGRRSYPPARGWNHGDQCG